MVIAKEIVRATSITSTLEMLSPWSPECAPYCVWALSHAESDHIYPEYNTFIVQTRMLKSTKTTK